MSDLPWQGRLDDDLVRGVVLIADDGRTVTGRAEITAELERDLGRGLPLEAAARHVLVVGDIAQIVVDRSIDGTVPTVSTCTSKARQAITRAAAGMDSGGT